MPAIGYPMAKSYPLSGTTDAQRPALGGEVIHDELSHIQLPIADPEKPILESCNIQIRVVKSKITGHLDFYYRIINLLSTAAHVKQVSIYGLGAREILTYADFRPDGLGTTAPTAFFPSKPGYGSANPADQIYVYGFNQLIPPNGSSRFFFFSTDIRTVTNGSLRLVFENPGLVRSDPGVEIVVPGPGQS